MPDTFIETVAIIPAIVFPGAALIQLVTLLKRGHAEGVSAITWWLFAVANICLYLYTQKYFEWVAMLTFLGTAILNIAVALTARRLKKSIIDSEPG